MNKIEGKVVGDKWVIRRNVAGIPPGLTLTDAWLTVKKTLGDEDASAVLQQHITSISSADGQIENVGGAGTAVLRFDLPGTKTSLMKPFVTYYYDVQVKGTDLEYDTPDTGIIVPVGQVTKTTS